MTRDSRSLVPSLAVALVALLGGVTPDSPLLTVVASGIAQHMPGGVRIPLTSGELYEFPDGSFLYVGTRADSIAPAVVAFQAEGWGALRMDALHVAGLLATVRASLTATLGVAVVTRSRDEPSRHPAAALGDSLAAPGPLGAAASLGEVAFVAAIHAMSDPEFAAWMDSGRADTCDEADCPHCRPKGH